MVTTAAFSGRRWRVFADAVASMLGLNLWVVLIVLPAVYVDAWTSPLRLAVGLVPLAALAFGVWRHSDAVLLFGFPTALLLPVSLSPEMVTGAVYGPIHFTFVALALVAYLFGVSTVASFREPPVPRHSRPLSSSRAATPPRWRRRLRLYRSLAILSALIPLVLLYKINFDEATATFVQKMYPGRAASFASVVNLTLLGFWLVIFKKVFLDTLEQHRTGDLALGAWIDVAHRRARSGKPRPVLYVGAAVALLLMAVLILGRLGGGP